MTSKDLRGALIAVLKEVAPDVPVLRSDVSCPVVRPSFKLDLLPVSGGAACAGAREREIDVDIWYYPRDATRPRDACSAVADKLLDALEFGFEAGGVWLYLDDGLDLDASDGVLSCQFGVSWTESAAEDGEPLETLIFNKEELASGDYDAEN